MGFRQKLVFATASAEIVEPRPSQIVVFHVPSLP